MKDRLITLFGGLFALYIAIALLAPPSQPDFTSKPLSTDVNRHGLALLKDWLEQNKIPVHSLRRRYDEVPSLADLPDTGNLMLISLPEKIAASADERAALRHWLSQGNTLLVMVAHSDAPEWASESNFRMRYRTFKLLNTLGFNIRQPVNGDEDDNKRDQVSLDDFKLTQLENASLVVTATMNSDIQKIAVDQTAYATQDWLLEPREDYRGTRTLLTETGNANTGAMWQARIGEGDAIISRYADLFSNAWLDEADNARLFSYLLQRHLGEDGYVLIDDMHQGLTDIYDPDAFYKDPRLHNTLWFLFGFWLLYLVGRTNRLAPPRNDASPAHAADFIRAMGGLFARRLSNPTTALGLLRHFFNEVRYQYGLPQNSQPVWDILDHAPRVAHEQIESLQQYWANAQHNKKQDLVKLHNQLRETRNRL